MGSTGLAVLALLATLAGGTPAGPATPPAPGGRSVPAATPATPAPLAPPAPAGRSGPAGTPRGPAGTGSASAGGHTPRPEIVGGVPALPGRYPWMVRLSVGCDGALYRPRVVLTAAHCVSRTGADRGIVATAGSVDLLRATVRLRSSYVYRAPGYPASRTDWALVELAAPVTGLATLPIAATTAYDTGTFTIVGWGTTDEGGSQQRYLRTAVAPYVDDAACGAVYKTAFRPAGMLCAGNLAAGGVDTCQGDSGGPMLSHDTAGRWVQVGIVSFGHGCARPHYPGIYTQVSEFAGQIAAAADRLP